MILTYLTYLHTCAMAISKQVADYCRFGHPLGLGAGRCWIGERRGTDGDRRDASTVSNKERHEAVLEEEGAILVRFALRSRMIGCGWVI